MRGNSISLLGTLVRGIFLLVGLSWLVMGILFTCGVKPFPDRDVKAEEGPAFIGAGLVLMAIVFAFSMRKRRARKRAAAESMELERRGIREGAEEGTSPTKSTMGRRLRILGYFYGVMFVLFGLGLMAGSELDEGEKMHSAVGPMMLVVGVVLLIVMRRLSSRAMAAS